VTHPLQGTQEVLLRVDLELLPLLVRQAHARTDIDDEVRLPRADPAIHQGEQHQGAHEDGLLGLAAQGAGPGIEAVVGRGADLELPLQVLHHRQLGGIEAITARQRPESLGDPDGLVLVDVHVVQEVAHPHLHRLRIRLAWASRAHMVPALCAP